MQSVTSVILASDQGVEQCGPAPLTEDERDVVSYFFVRLRLIDPVFFDQVAPDEATQALVKREFANMLRRFSRRDVDLGLAGLKRAMAERHPEFKFLTLPKIIGLVECGGKLPGKVGDVPPAGIYRELRPNRVLEDHDARERRLQAGRSACEQMLSMFEGSGQAACK